MTAFQLPYQGYSWSINQHIGPATQRRTMYELLQAAYIYSRDPSHQEKITEYIVDQQILTANVREDAGRPQAWRDYQQVLSELGLIISTRFTRDIGVVITPIGLMWLDGAIGYSELVTTQCLRYQYPNGHKQDISHSLGNYLTTKSGRVPATRTELDTVLGVMIKPAVLMLRILIELQKARDPNPTLSVKECLAALVPIRKNNEWKQALDNLKQIRERGFLNLALDKRRIRHIQEWFRLLDISDIFEVFTKNRETLLQMSSVALENIEDLQQLCVFHEHPDNFWVPTTTDKEQLGLSWFDYFGNPNISSQWLTPEKIRDSNYLNENYPAGIEQLEEFEEVEGAIDKEFTIKLQPLLAREIETLTDHKVPSVDVDKIVQGHRRRERSTRLHEQIVRIVAEQLQQHGYSVAEDRSSVDLLVSRHNKESIVEVKTVTRRNLYNRIRLGIGQLAEYRYRRQQQSNIRPSALMVLSSTYDFPDWYIHFLESDIGFGLLGFRSGNEFLAYTSGELESLLSS